MIEAFDALNSVISKAQGSSGPSRGAGWKARQQLRSRQRDRNRAETERSQAAAAKRKQGITDYTGKIIDKYHFDPNEIINLGIYHPQFGHIPHGKTAEGTRQRMRGMTNLMDDIDPKRHKKALKKLKQILSGELVPSGDTETGETHHVHRDTMPYDWSEASGLADEETGKISEEDMDRIRGHGIHGHVPSSVGNEATDWLKQLGIDCVRVRDKIYCQVDGNNFMIPIKSPTASTPLARGHDTLVGRLNDSNPFNPDNKLTPAPDDDELWARKVQAWRDANTKDLSQAHRGVKFRDDAHPSDRGDLLSWWEPNIQREGDSFSREGENIKDSKLEAALEAGWKKPEHPTQPMISPREQSLSDEVAAKTPVRAPSEAQSRALRATRSSAGGRPKVLTGMAERGVPVREDDEIVASSDTLPVTTPISTAFLFLKDGEMAPIQAPQGNMTSGGQENSSSRKSPGEASQELKDKEMDHNATVNNPATQEWVDRILPSSQDFHQKMVDWYHSAGLAMHDPEYKKNAKPAEKAMMALSNMIAHFRARDDDTPGFGMKRDDENSSTLDSQDKQYLGL